MEYNTKFLQVFLNKLCEFIEKLEDRFPNENDITLLYEMVKMVRKTHPTSIVEQWGKHIMIYDEQIKKKDLGHFIKMEYGKHLNDLQNKNEIHMKIDYFKKILDSKDTDDETKEVIWAYLGLLNRLYDKVIVPVASS